ncbi:MAG TPA: nicotinamide-nucleotide amidase [Gammaproteobacteria bacterium]|nr:nicotinamide-nucleotide amidase [Gammaproteobacteria bacterium]
MDRVQQLACQLGERLLQRRAMLVTAESCTGGWIAKVITDIPGSSRWFERGFVTYTNVAKREMLGVSEEVLESYGAVSEQTVQQMASGALAHSHAQLSVAVSGIAGPGGAVPGKPVGTVWFAWADSRGWMESHREHFTGDREAVRQGAVWVALEGLRDAAG